MRYAALGMCLLLAGCATRAVLHPLPDNITTTTRTIFTQTLRLQSEDGFSSTRSAAPSYLRYEISVPPQREIGEVSYPTRRVDPTKHMLVAEEVQYETEANYFNTLAGENDTIATELFVHGFNNNHADGVLRMAQIAEDFGLTGPSVHLSWPSAALAVGYGYDRESVLVARDTLERKIRKLTAQQPVVIIAHSMGSHLVMEALRQIAIAGDEAVFNRIEGLVLISPDIGLDVFKSQLARIGTLPERFVIFTSTRDRALRASAKINGIEARVGNLSDTSDLEALGITVFDLSEVSGGDSLGHFTAVTSPEAIALIKNTFQDLRRR